MKVSLKFDELSSVLNMCATIIGDKSVDDKMRNVIFLFHNGEGKAVGYNAFTFARLPFGYVEEEDMPDEGWEFQLKASDLNKVLSSFSNLSRTKVSTISFYKSGVKIGIEIYEEAVEGADERLSQKSHFTLESAPILANVLKEVHMEFPEDGEILSSDYLSVYLDSMLPLLSSEGGKLCFAPDYVFTISSKMSAFFVNRLTDAFKELTLSYSSVSFLKKLCEKYPESDLIVQRIDKYLCIQTEGTESFMKYQRVSQNYRPYVDRFKKDMGIVVDRMYLRDVVRRMGNMSQDGKMFVQDDSTLRVVNDVFEQMIPLNNIRPGTEGVGFNVSIPLLDKVMIGKNNILSSDEVFIYFVPTPRGYTIYLADRSGVWFSSTQVTRA